MRRLLAQALATPGTAILAVAALASLSRFLFPALMVSTAVLGLVILRYGLAAGCKVGGGALALVVAVAWLAGQPLLGEALPLLLVGVGVVSGAFLLRAGMSPGLVLVWVGAVTLGYVALARGLAGDIDAWWLRVLTDWARQPAFADQPQEFLSLFQGMAPWMNATLSGVMMLSMVVGCGLARYWQSLLTGAGDFGVEFRSLWLGPGASLVGGVCFALALQGYIWREMAVMSGVIGGLVGLALFHARVHGSAGGRWWLLALYAGIVVLPPISLPPLVAVGYLDGWLDLRGLRRRRHHGGPPGPQDG
jgi:hypothetical protein